SHKAPRPAQLFIMKRRREISCSFVTIDSGYKVGPVRNRRPRINSSPTRGGSYESSVYHCSHFISRFGRSCEKKVNKVTRLCRATRASNTLTEVGGLFITLPQDHTHT